MPAREKAKLRPLWACPRCGQRFVSPNMWHSCVRMTVREHLQGRPKEVVDLYSRFARMVRDLGPGVKAVSVKTGIGFMVRVRFAGFTLQKGGLRVSFWLKRRIDSPRFARVELIRQGTSSTPSTSAHQMTSTTRFGAGWRRLTGWASTST